MKKIIVSLLLLSSLVLGTSSESFAKVRHHRRHVTHTRVVYRTHRSHGANANVGVGIGPIHVGAGGGVGVH